MNLTDINEIKALLGRHGFRFSKSMGQNFLCARNVPEDIAASAGIDDKTGVLEIGPGIGCLTNELSKYAKKVLSIELDESLRPILSETVGSLPNVEIYYGDALKTDLRALLGEKLAGCDKIVACANIPYNITSPLITVLLESCFFSRVTIMIQKEVAKRICARPGTADYGAFTLLCRWYSEPEILFDVPASCFIPAPKVTSSVITMDILPEPPVKADRDKLMKIVRAAFNQRRKTLPNALMSGFGRSLSREEAEGALIAAGIDVKARGETLSLEDFARLSEKL